MYTVIKLNWNKAIVDQMCNILMQNNNPFRHSGIPETL